MPGYKKTDEATKLLDALAHEMQEVVMGMRAHPVKPVFQRMSRVMREAQQATGKNINLVLIGEDTEIDRTIVEKISDPLTHIVRNAADHGIEENLERTAVGKSSDGTVTIRAFQRSGRVIIEISDDGRGMDPDYIFKKAIDKGLVDSNAELSATEKLSLIFLPGFSTAQKGSSLSGRGVGMDVVKKNISEVGGRVFLKVKKDVVQYLRYLFL